MELEKPSISRAPLARGIIVHGFREAAAQLWGPGALATIAAHLPDDVRAATVDREPAVLDWHPERFVMSWHEAVWAGPSRGEDRTFCAFLDRAVDLSFGRVRRVMLSFVTPLILVTKAADLWRHDHTHGTLSIEPLDESRNEIAVTLREHPYATTPRSRRALAEIIRHIASLTREKNVRETHAPGPAARTDAYGELTVRLSWGPSQG